MPTSLGSNVSTCVRPTELRLNATRSALTESELNTIVSPNVTDCESWSSPPVSDVRMFDDFEFGGAWKNVVAMYRPNIEWFDESCTSSLPTAWRSSESLLRPNSTRPHGSVVIGSFAAIWSADPLKADGATWLFTN